MFNHLDPEHHMNPGKLLPEEVEQMTEERKQRTEDRGQK
jgi:hypothetical protein